MEMFQAENYIGPNYSLNITENISDTGGGRCVFKGILSQGINPGEKVAIKQLFLKASKELIDYNKNYFKYAFLEMATMIQNAHPCIVRLRGYFFSPSGIDVTEESRTFTPLITISSGSISSNGEKSIPSVFIITPFASCGSLDKILGNNNPLLSPINQTIWAYGLFHSMWFLHSRNVHQRDVKCGNLFIDSVRVNGKEQKLPLLADFGCSKQKNDISFDANSYRFGTPMYIPPEASQKDATIYGKAADVYEAGVTYNNMMKKKISENSQNSIYTGSNAVYERLCNKDQMKRPPFHSIVQEFAVGQHRVPGTDENEFISYFNSVREGEKALCLNSPISLTMLWSLMFDNSDGNKKRTEDEIMCEMERCDASKAYIMYRLSKYNDTLPKKECSVCRILLEAITKGNKKAEKYLQIVVREEGFTDKLGIFRQSPDEYYQTFLELAMTMNNSIEAMILISQELLKNSETVQQATELLESIRSKAPADVSTILGSYYLRNSMITEALSEVKKTNAKTKYFQQIYFDSLNASVCNIAKLLGI